MTLVFFSFLRQDGSWSVLDPWELDVSQKVNNIRYALAEATAKVDGGVANACIHVSKVLWEEEREAASRLVDEAMRDSFHELLGKRVR